MNRAEFMAALEAQLRDITTEERDEALKFYNEYLDEAGPENEAAVLAELGSPQKVACIIRANCGFGVPAVRDAAEKSTAPEKPEQAPVPELTLDGPDWQASRPRRRKQNALGPKASARTRKLRTVFRMRRRRTARSTALPMHTAIPKTAPHRENGRTLRLQPHALGHPAHSHLSHLDRPHRRPVRRRSGHRRRAVRHCVRGLCHNDRGRGGFRRRRWAAAHIRSQWYPDDGSQPAVHLHRRAAGRGYGMGRGQGRSGALPCRRSLCRTLFGKVR